MSYSVWTGEGKRQKFSLLHQSKGMMEQAKLSTEIASKVRHGLLLKCSPVYDLASG